MKFRLIQFCILIFVFYILLYSVFKTQNIGPTFHNEIKLNIYSMIIILFVNQFRL